MARGHDRHQAHVAAVQALGRTLSRRARAACELCGARGVPLRVLEVPPTLEAPDPERAVLVDARCADLLEGGRLPSPDQLRFLETAAWSEVLPVQVAAVRLARRVAEHPQGTWARELLDGLYLSEEAEALLSG